jgi:quercetin dioxygenase-like cupin family protein
LTRVLDIADPARGEEAGEFQGRILGASVSVIVVDAPPGGGPRLHRHPYEEVFVVQEGSATFTAGEDVIEARGGQVIVVPAGVAHKFVNSGAGRLRQVDRCPQADRGPPLRRGGTSLVGSSASSERSDTRRAVSPTRARRWLA